MRINISKSKNHEFIYIIRDIYNNGSRTTKIHKKLGKIEDLCSEKNMSRDEVIAWAKNYAKELTVKDNDISQDTITSSASSSMPCSWASLAIRRISGQTP